MKTRTTVDVMKGIVTTEELHTVPTQVTEWVITEVPTSDTDWSFMRRVRKEHVIHTTREVWVVVDIRMATDEEIVSELDTMLVGL